jgi:hypothetical protein
MSRPGSPFWSSRIGVFITRGPPRGRDLFVAHSSGSRNRQRGPHRGRTDRSAAVSGHPSDPRPSAMLRTLINERFRLKTQTEVKQMAIYALVLDQADHRLGSGLRQSSGDCVPPGAAGALVATQLCGFRRVGPNGMSGYGITMELLAGVLADLSDIRRGVRNRTNLTGRFDLDLEFMSITNRKSMLRLSAIGITTTAAVVSWRFQAPMRTASPQDDAPELLGSHRAGFVRLLTGRGDRPMDCRNQTSLRRPNAYLCSRLEIKVSSRKATKQQAH